MATTQRTIRSAPVLCAACCLLSGLSLSNPAAWGALRETATLIPIAGNASRGADTLPGDSLFLDAADSKTDEREREAVTRIAASEPANADDAGIAGSTEEFPGASQTGSTAETPEAVQVSGSLTPAVEEAVSAEAVGEAAQVGGGWMDPASLVAEAQPLGAPSPQRGAGAATSNAFSGSGILRTLIALGIVIALIYACRGVLRRAVRNSGSLSVLLTAGGRAPSGVLEVLGRYPIAKRTTLVLLKVDCRVLLLSQSEHGFQTLAEISDPEEVASILRKTSSEQSDSLSDRFASIFRQFERGGGVENTPLEPEIVDLTGSRNPLASLRMKLAGMQERRA